MELLHTEEEIKFWNQQNQLAIELEKLAKQHGSIETKDLANTILSRVKFELSKYDHLVGKKYTLKARSMYDQPNDRTGILTEITHFNYFSKSVRGKFNYSDSGGWDGVALKDLEEIIDTKSTINRDGVIYNGSFLQARQQPIKAL